LFTLENEENERAAISIIDIVYAIFSEVILESLLASLDAEKCPRNRMVAYSSSS